MEPMARWLDDEEQRAWRAYLEATQELFARLDHELARDAGLAHPDYEILVRLSEAPSRRLRMSELAANAVFSRSRLSHAVARLEAEGLVERETCETDRRGTFAVLTPKGRKALEAAAPGHVEGVRRYLFDHLDRRDVEAMRRVFDGVRRALREA